MSALYVEGSCRTCRKPYRYELGRLRELLERDLHAAVWGDVMTEAPTALSCCAWSACCEVPLLARQVGLVDELPPMRRRRR